MQAEKYTDRYLHKKVKKILKTLSKNEQVSDSDESDHDERQKVVSHMLRQIT